MVAAAANAEAAHRPADVASADAVAARRFARRRSPLSSRRNSSGSSSSSSRRRRRTSLRRHHRRCRLRSPAPLVATRRSAAVAAAAAAAAAAADAEAAHGSADAAAADAVAARSPARRRSPLSNRSNGSSTAPPMPPRQLRSSVSTQLGSFISAQLGSFIPTRWEASYPGLAPRALRPLRGRLRAAGVGGELCTHPPQSSSRACISDAGASPRGLRLFGRFRCDPYPVANLICLMIPIRTALG